MIIKNVCIRNIYISGVCIENINAIIAKNANVEGVYARNTSFAYIRDAYIKVAYFRGVSISSVSVIKHFKIDLQFFQNLEIKSAKLEIQTRTGLEVCL